jgi:prevent-host-death family protein
MTITVNIQEAKTSLSSLLAAVEQGREVIIANRGKPVARLTPFRKSRKKRPLGFLNGTLPATFFDPVPEEVLQQWSL